MEEQQLRRLSTFSIASSPGSSSLPSPPSSPHHQSATFPGNGSLLDSLPASPSSITSSFPSGASSYIFSTSAHSSPPHIVPLQQAHHQADAEGGLGLVIPSLTLPAPRRRRKMEDVTQYGDTLGTLDLYIFGRKGAGKTAIGTMLVEGNEEVVSVDGWEANVLRASTRWKDASGKRGTRNIRITEVDGFDEEEDQAADVIQPFLQTLHSRFEKIARSFPSDSKLTPDAMAMLASSNTTLPTAMIFLLSSPPTPLELTLLSLLSTHIPVITLPPYPPSVSSVASFASLPISSMQSTILLGPTTAAYASPATFSRASFRPRNTLELRTGLFRSPSVLRGLRKGAAERFSHWREIRHACVDLGMSSYIECSDSAHESDYEKQEKLGWELRLSKDIAIALKGGAGHSVGIKKEEPSEATLLALEAGPDPSKEEEERFHADAMGPDPLHLPTLIRLSGQLLGAFGRRLVSSFIVTRQEIINEKHDLFEFGAPADEDTVRWTLSAWGIAGIAFAIGFYAGRILPK